MNGKEELQARIQEKQERINELINKFVLTSEISKLNHEVAELRIACGVMYGHEYEDGSELCKWCGHRKEADE